MTRWHAASMIYKTEHHTLLINDNGHEHVSDNDNSCRVRATMSPIAKNMSVHCTNIRATLHMKTMSLNGSSTTTYTTIHIDSIALLYTKYIKKRTV